MPNSFHKTSVSKKIVEFLLENLPIDPAIENWIRARGGHCEEVSQEEGEVVVRPTVHLVMIMRIMNIESLELTASPFEKGHIPGLQSPR